MTEDVGDSLDIVIWVQAWKLILPMELEVFKAKKNSTAGLPHSYKSGKGEFGYILGLFGKATYYSFVSFFSLISLFRYFEPDIENNKFILIICALFSLLCSFYYPII